MFDRVVAEGFEEKRLPGAGGSGGLMLKTAVVLPAVFISGLIGLVVIAALPPVMGSAPLLHGWPPRRSSPRVSAKPSALLVGLDHVYEQVSPVGVGATEADEVGPRSAIRRPQPQRLAGRTPHGRFADAAITAMLSALKSPTNPGGTTHLLLKAAAGAGKSYALRRLIAAAAGSLEMGSNVARLGTYWARNADGSR